jgi:hypothetical protein
MLEAQTYIVRIYRRKGALARGVAGVVEIVEQRRSVAFRGLPALCAILTGPPTRCSKGAGLRGKRTGDAR